MEVATAWHSHGDAELLLHEIAVLTDGRASPRKTRLFAVACCRRVWHLLDEQLRAAVEAAEQFADGSLPLEQFVEVSDSLKEGHGYDLPDTIPQGAFEAMSWAVMSERELYPSEAASGAWWALTGLFGQESLKVPAEEALRQEARAVEQRVQADLVREIFGNPYRPVTAEPSWFTPTVVALARGIEREQAFDSMPILADALQEAGCDNDDILNHCRSDGPHVRGCWVVDLVLGRE